MAALPQRRGAAAFCACIRFQGLEYTTPGPVPERLDGETGENLFSTTLSAKKSPWIFSSVAQPLPGKIAALLEKRRKREIFSVFVRNWAISSNFTVSFPFFHKKFKFDHLQKWRN
ncbi:MAG: hypothetical protein LUG45_07740 [Clostridiales bacterium]|nr:hypothetical protein [Clostridiales bacterium]